MLFYFQNTGAGPQEVIMSNLQNPQEIHEAINAADDALIALRKAEKSLSNAGGWGLWDILGGGFISTFLKHERIDKAQSELEEARRALTRFRSELNDVGRAADFNLDVSSFLRFTDYFFDDIFSDLMVQSKISKGRRQVQQAIDQIENIRRQLWSMLG